MVSHEFRYIRMGVILERCVAGNVAYEPMVFENTGGIEEGG